MEEPIIQFENVSFSYDSAPILKEASFEILNGEFIGVIGPNGGGKTTALNLMLNFLKPNKGTISIPHRKKIGYVPQNNSYDKEFPISVLEVVLTGVASKIRFFGTIPSKEKRKAIKLLDKLGIASLKNAPYGSLSGGQAQKVLFARALISDPDILLLDEPTANIDPESEAAIFDFLNELKGKKTIVIVMHNFDAIIKNVERVLCFQNEVSSLKPSEVCKHFSIGMYHPTKEA